MEGNTGLIVQDLAWTRCWQFRVGIASLFDDKIAQAALEHITRVQIQHNTKNRNTALQILAWIAVQADWKHLGGFSFKTKSGTSIQAEVHGCAESASLGLVELSSENTCVRVSHEKGAAHLLREVVSGEYRVSSLSPADPEASADLVAQQLARGGKNSLFLKVLPLYLELLKEA
jgi:glucose-6-phosphate dehydrogenase assembly protein OpcA